MSDMLTLDQSELLASIAGTLAGGRHAFRVSDASVKDAAQSIARQSRKARNARRMAASRAVKSETRERYFADYDVDTLATIAELRTVWATMPKRATIRDIARAVLHNSDKCRNCVAFPCDNSVIPENWRETVREFARGVKRSRELGAFPIKRDDMRQGTSTFGYSVLKHWHAYAGGKHVTVHGHDSEDALQMAFLAAIESGDTVARFERVLGTGEKRLVHVPTYGALWMHVRQSVNALATGRSLAGMRTFGHGNDEIDPFDFDTFEPRTVNDWLAYETWRDMRDSHARTVARIERERAERLIILSETRKSLATLISTGMSVTRIAHALGRTVDGILKDLSDDMAPATHSLPVVVTDADMEAHRERVMAQAAHAAFLRRRWEIVSHVQGGSRFTDGHTPEWHRPSTFKPVPTGNVGPYKVTVRWADNVAVNV